MNIIIFRIIISLRIIEELLQYIEICNWGFVTDIWGGLQLILISHPLHLKTYLKHYFPALGKYSYWKEVSCFCYRIHFIDLFIYIYRKSV